MHRVSIVIPVYQGASTLPTLVEEIAPLTRQQTTPGAKSFVVCEVLLVHDCGPDRSDKAIESICAQYPFVKSVWLSRNYGQHAATLAGMARATGDWVVTYIALGQLFPSSVDGSYYNLQGALTTFLNNARKLADMNVHYPPLLVHALPVFLALFFLSFKQRFVVASVAFALGMSVVYMIFSNYEEVRAHMVVLVLVLPSALLTLKRFLDSAASKAPVVAA